MTTNNINTNLTEAHLLRAIVVDRFREGHMSVLEAATALGVSGRHIHRLRNKVQTGGLAAVLPQRRSTPAHNKLDDQRLTRITELLQSELVGYGPTQAAEVLTDEYGLTVSREAVRKIMIKEGLWRPHGRGGKGKTRVHRPRERRSRFGELVLADTSFHEWIVDCGKLGLVVLIDDATGRLLNLSFTQTETCLAYMKCFEGYVMKHGLPESLYADRHKALLRLRSDWQEAGTRFESEFARGLVDLGVLPIPSFSPQGRGRVERAHRTLQDRLPKFLKRRGANSIDLATALLPEFIRHYNSMFAVTPPSEADAHRPCPSCDVLRVAMSLQEFRQLSGSLVLAYRNRKLVIENCQSANAAIGKYVTIHTHTNGNMSVRFNGSELPFSERQAKVKATDCNPFSAQIHRAPKFMTPVNDKGDRMPSLRAG